MNNSQSANWDQLLNSRLDASLIDRTVVGGVLVVNSRVLLLRRRGGDFLEGLWELPSGKMEETESPVEALRREVLEETGLEIVRVAGYVGDFDYTSQSGRRTRQVNLVAVTSHSPVLLSEHDDFGWFTVEEMGDLNVSEETAECVRLGMRTSTLGAV